MEEEKIEQAVLAYLKKKGYRQAELAFQDEQQTHRSLNSSSGGGADGGGGTTTPSMDPAVANSIFLYARADGTLYKEGYSKLRSWVHSSLDLYKNELLRILYPVFVHCFMDLVAKDFPQEARLFFQTFREDHDTLHLRDLHKLEGVLSPQHLQESELAVAFRENKINIRMCQYSFELLLQYLHSTDSMLMLGIVNEHINIQVFPGQPSPLPEEEEAITLTGKPQEALDSMNQKELRWGTLEDSLEDKLEKELAAEAEKAEAEGKETEADDMKKRTADGGKAGASSKKSKKDKTGTSATGKGAKSDSAAAINAPRVKPDLPMPSLAEETERQVLEDLRNRARLGSNALPSVSFYSFVNTHNSLNCASISADGALVAGGFSDSSLKVWDMAKIGAQITSGDQGTANGVVSNGVTEPKGVALENSKSSYTLLQGHAGPVYAANFSPDNDYLLSCSGDCTVRLWSLRLNANLVCYKGHNYPVWDVQYSPVGHYFASASHDRTARVWCMERLHPLRILAGHLSDVDCVQWHVNCNYIATGSSDKTVRLWDVQTGECMRIFTGHRGMVLSLAMSSDGRYMASGDEDGAILMWDLGSGRCVTPLLGHTGCVWTLAFSGEGSLLASGSADNTVRLWDVNASGKTSRTEEKSSGKRRLRLLKTLPTKSTPVYALKFSRRNLLLAAGAFSPLKTSVTTG
ncbi:unnamed protein product [Sphagnum jensenii]|uniref:TFIID subunit TAF5 NTD2 domain-containing protein n=3 Tax=Sphagnum jensenii TaxID=128206 RepID=A0ABP1BD00_9BRYO